MGPKKGRRVRKIEVPTDSVPEFEKGVTVAGIQWRRQKREAREREEAQQQSQRKEEARREEARRSNHTLKRKDNQKKGPGQKEVTLKQRLVEERWNHHSRVTRRGT